MLSINQFEKYPKHALSHLIFKEQIWKWKIYLGVFIDFEIFLNKEQSLKLKLTCNWKGDFN